MQKRKMNQQVTFLIYRIGTLFLSLYLYKYLEIIIEMLNKNRTTKFIKDCYIKYRYTIILFQTLAFILVTPLINKLSTIDIFSAFKILILAIVIVPLAAIIGNAMSWIEKI